MKLIRKMVSILLCTAISFQIVAPAFAMAIENDAANDRSVQPGSESVLPYVMQEEIDLREETAKTFLLSDGSYLTAMYPSAVHKQNEAGEWIQIDNRLQEVAASRSVDGKASLYRTGVNGSSLKVSFSASLRNGTIFSVENAGCSVSVGLIERNFLDEQTEASTEPAADSSVQEDSSVPAPAAAAGGIAGGFPADVREPDGIAEGGAAEEEAPAETEPAADSSVQEDSSVPAPAAAAGGIAGSFPADVREPDDMAEGGAAEEEAPAETEPAPDSYVQEDSSVPAPAAAAGGIAGSFPADVREPDDMAEGGAAGEEAPAETEPAPDSFVQEDSSVPAPDVPTPAASDKKNGTLSDLYPELLSNMALEEPSEIEIIPQPASPAEETNGTPLSELVQNPGALEVDGLCQKIRYERVFEHVDLEYVIYGNTVKENILVNSPLDSYQFAFRLDLAGLAFGQNADKSISLKNSEGEVEFRIEKPFMFDANGVIGDDVTQQIIEHDGRHYLLLTADPAWFENAAFPVTIDPTITTDINLSQSIRSSYVTEANHYNDVSLLAAGRLPSEDRRLRGYVRFDLPSLPAGSIISRAYLQMGVVEIYDYNGADPRLYATAYLCPGAWDPAAIAWNTQPGAPNRNPKEYMTLVESHDIYAGDKGCYIAFDVTKAVSAWKQDPSSNYGLIFADGYEENNYNHYTTLSTYLYGNYPVLTVAYRVAKGLEPYWETYAAEIEGAGTAHVNLFTGSLTVELPVCADTAQNMPFSYSLFYNSIDKNLQTAACLHGLGWRSNLTQSVSVSSEGNARYRYVDADGTPHYIVLDDSGKYIDEDGLNLTLTSSSNAYILEDRDRTQYYFSRTAPGYLFKVRDSNGSETNIAAGSSNIRVTASGGRIFNVTKNSGNYFTAFSDCLGKTTTVDYAGNKLTQIHYPDGKCTSISYSAANNITRITGPNGYALGFEWDSQGRVASITEYSGAKGQTVAFDYSSYCTTRVRTGGTDDTYGNADDLITHYLFDEWGRTATIYTTNVDRSKIYGVQNTAFSKAESGNTSNRLTKAAAHGGTVVNLLSNGNLERGVSGYTISNWEGSAAATVEAVRGSGASFAYHGYQSGKLNASANSGIAAAQRTLTLPAGSYTFSGYLRTENVQAPGGGGAALGVRANGAVHCSQKLTGTSGNSFSIDGQSTLTNDSSAYAARNRSINEEVEAGWQRVSVTFELAAQTTVALGIVLDNAVGTVWFDALQLEKGTVANPYNLLENSGFEESASGTLLPSGWWGGSGMSASSKVWDHIYSAADQGYAPMDGTKAYRMEGRVNYGSVYDTGLIQSVPIRGQAGDVYTVSGWVNLWSVPDTTYPNSIHRIACRVLYSNGKFATIATADANPYFIGWQYVSESFVLKNDQPGGVTITGLEVVLQYDNVPFYAAFDNIHLTKDEGVTYTYDAEGKLISTAALKEQTANVHYNDSTDLPEYYTDVDGNRTTYTYNTATRNLLTTTAPSGLTTTLNYDAGYKGQANSQVISGGGLNIYTSQAMLDGGNFAYSSTNALGNTGYVYYNIYDPDYTGSADHILPDPLTAYPYAEGVSSGAAGYTDPNPGNNRLTGQLFAVTDANGNTTAYSYTDDDDLAGVSSSQSSVAYTYGETGLLASITSGDEVYRFTYTPFGAVERIQAGSTDIAVNTYRSGNGKLLSTQYAGTTLSYSYDELGRVAQSSYSGGDTVSYKYDGNGNLVQRSQAGGVAWDFVYDNAGTLVGSARDNVYWAKYKYDAGGRLTALARRANGQSRYTGFAYNKFGTVSSVLLTGGTADITGANTYDGLGRLVRKQWTQGGSQLFTGYGYQAGAGGANAASTQLDTVLFGTGTDTIAGGRKYLYDHVGNITEEQHRSADGSYAGKVWYSYDANSQLVRVDDLVNGETVQYTYDVRGNLTGRSVYAYTRDETVSGPALRTDAWTYGGPDGNTLLSSTIDGATTNYTYPYYGVPSNWTGGRALTWRNGRTLESVGDTGFVYDGEGQRVSKTSGGVTTEYIYEGGQLVMQTQGGASLFFLYDAGGLFGFDLIVNGTAAGTYYYRIDGKGEITALTDAAGNVVANYAYDAWGANLGVTDAAGNAVTDSTHIGIVNPFRYKGYYYDTETGLYYLNSRYYDPEVCRFISADDPVYLGVDGTLQSYNLFAYCKNNPVIGYDPTGHFGFVSAIITTGAVIGGLLGAFSAATTGGNVLEATIEGCLTGAMGAVCGLSYSSPIMAGIIASVGGTVIDIGTQVATQYLTGQKVSIKKIDLWRAAKVGLQTGIGAVIPAFGDAAGNAIDAFGTALIWAEASTLIVCTDVIASNTVAMIKASARTSSRNRHRSVTRQREMLLM